MQNNPSKLIDRFGPVISDLFQSHEPLSTSNVIEQEDNHRWTQAEKD